MATAKNNESLVKKLKKQVTLLQRKEQQSRNQLHNALKKIRKMGRAYKSKLASKVRIMKGKVSEAQASTYGKIASELEQQLLKSIETKGKALKAIISKLEKKHISKLTKGIAKKGKISRVKKAVKSSKAKPLTTKAKSASRKRPRKK